MGCYFFGDTWNCSCGKKTGFGGIINFKWKIVGLSPKGTLTQWTNSSIVGIQLSTSWEWYCSTTYILIITQMLHVGNICLHFPLTVAAKNPYMEHMGNNFRCNWRPQFDTPTISYWIPKSNCSISSCRFFPCFHRFSSHPVQPVCLTQKQQTAKVTKEVSMVTFFHWRPPKRFDAKWHAGVSELVLCCCFRVIFLQYTIPKRFM